MGIVIVTNQLLPFCRRIPCFRLTFSLTVHQIEISPNTTIINYVSLIRCNDLPFVHVFDKI
jgi:hypothetical protein